MTQLEDSRKEESQNDCVTSLKEDGEFKVATKEREAADGKRSSAFLCENVFKMIDICTLFSEAPNHYLMVATV